MNQRAMIAAASAAFAAEAQVHPEKPTFKYEKCYGIAKAGQNDCANLGGTHSCAGQAKVSDSPTEWKYVAKGTCAGMKGLTADQAKAKVKAAEGKKS